MAGNPITRGRGRRAIPSRPVVSHGGLGCALTFSQRAKDNRTAPVSELKVTVMWGRQSVDEISVGFQEAVAELPKVSVSPRLFLG